MALRIRESLKLDEILQTAVDEVRQFLQTDRVIIYRFNPDFSGTVAVESVAAGWQPALNSTIRDTCFGKNYAQAYKEGRTQVTEDIYTAELTQCHIDILVLYDIRASLVVPILQGEHLWGLLCAYHCSGPRHWRQFEVDLLKQLATHMAIAIQQSELYYQVQSELAERKRAEEQLKVSLKEKEALLKEIHHRVKNNLQVVSSVLRLQSDYIKDERVLALFSDSQNRIRSMALIHEKLYQSKDLLRIDFGEYIRDLTSNLLRSYAASSQAVTLRISADDIWLNIDTAIPCGLIINELISNSLKHAFPIGREDNEIHIIIRSTDDNKYALTVSDNGIGLPVNLDFRNTASFGLELVGIFTEQIEGAIELDRSNGAKFTITFTELEAH
jgi:two-component sensor histidine kinase